MTTCHLQPLPYHPDPTPLFGRFADAPGAVLLDSGRHGGARGRYDIASAWPLDTLQPSENTSGGAFLAQSRGALRQLGPAANPAGVDAPFCGGLIGYLAYDFGRRLERLPGGARDDLGLPEARLGLYDWAFITDHATRSSYLLFHPSASTQRRRIILDTLAQPAAPARALQLTGAFQADLPETDYRQAIARIQAYIQAGDCYQVNFTQRFSTGYTGAPWEAYTRLRTACPTPFSAYLALAPGQALLSLSPERFMAVRDGRVETRPIKGTRPRGTTPAEDACFARALLESEKDRAENLMIVDLLRNDLGRTCAPGTVRVPELFALESYPNVHHLVSSIEGELAPGRDVFDLLAGSFPGGSITGAPKIRAMQIIDELEPTRRGPYCGSMLYLDARGRMDSSILIRTLLAWRGRLHCWGGGGIVADSEWRAEHAESLTKVRVLLDTLAG